MSPRPPLRDTGFRSRRSASGNDLGNGGGGERRRRAWEALDNDVLLAKLESRLRPSAYIAPKRRLSFLEPVTIDPAVCSDFTFLVAHRVHADGEEFVTLDEMLKRVERFGEKATVTEVVILGGEGADGGRRLLLRVLAGRRRWALTKMRDRI
jgi:hypothetical protein